MSKLTRRRLLQATGAALGTSLVAPFLRRAWAAAPPIARLVIVVEGNGIYARAFGSDKAKQALAAAGASIGADDMTFHKGYRHNQPVVVTGDPLNTPIGSLGPLASGGPSLVAKSAVVLGLSSTVAGGGHSSDQGGLACARGNASKTPAITIDAAIAAKIGTQTPFDAVRLGVSDEGFLSYKLCAFGPGRPAPITTSPTNAYAALFSAIAGGASQAQIDDRRNLLDFARGDISEALSSFNGSSVERAKLETYLAAVETSQTRQQRLLALRSKVQPLVPPGPVTDPRYLVADPLDRLAVQFDLATASLLGGLTNVVVLASGPGGGLGLVYSKVLARYFTDDDEVSMARHPLQHGAGDPVYRSAILDVTAEHVKMIARMARTLDAQPEDGGTMLDHTLILYMSDNGEQHHSEAKEWPMLLVGGRKLGFKTDGRTVIYPGSGNANNRQVSNMFNTLGHATGDTSMDAFGEEGSTRLAKGPLGSEIWSPV